MGDSADTARERQAAKKKPLPKKPPPKKPSADARAFGAATAIFIPPALQGKPKPPPKSVLLKPKLETVPQKKKRQASETKAREDMRIGIKTKVPTGPNRLDAVPVYHTKAQQHALDMLENPPSATTGNAKTLRDWKLGVITTSKLSPAEKKQLKAEVTEDYLTTGWKGPSIEGIGAGLAEAIRPVASLVIPNPGGLNPRRGGEIKTPGDLAKKYEEATDVLAGKSISNVAFHGDLPKSGGEAGGLALGIAGILPVGRIPRAIMAIKGATKAGAAEKIYAKSAQAVAKASSREEIASSRTAVKEMLDTHTAEVEAIQTAHADKPMTAAGRRNLKTHEDAIQSLRVHDQILKRAQDLQPKGELVGPNPFAFTPVEQASNLARRLKVGPIKYANRRRLDANGIPYVGRITPEEAVIRMEHATPDAAQRAHDAAFYQHVGPKLGALLEDKEIMAWLASQVGASPSRGILDLMRVLDAVASGREIPASGPGSIGLAAHAMRDILAGNTELSSGAAAKISDFIDSALQSPTRNWVGHHPRPEGSTLWGDPNWGGAPAVADRWGARSAGLVDAAGVKQMKDRFGATVKTDMAAGLTETQYEQVAKFYHDMTDVMNARNFDGRSDWIPLEVQAMDWAAIQRYWGVEPEDLAYAIEANTRRVNLELTHGIQGLGNDLTMAQRQQVAREMEPVLRAHAEARGLRVSTVEHGTSAYEASQNASVHIGILAGPEHNAAVKSWIDELANELDQYEVWATKPGTAGGKVRIALRITAPGLDDLATQTRFWEAVRAEAPDLVGYMPFTRSSGEKGITIITSKGYKDGKSAAETAQRYQAAIDKAEEAIGVPVSYDSQSTSVLVGESSGEVSGALGGAGQPGVVGASDPEGLRSQLEAAISRAQAGEGEEGLLARLKGERGSVDIEQFGLPRSGTRDLDEILADHVPRELRVGEKTQQMQGARGRKYSLPKVIERGADRVSMALEPGSALGRAGRLPFVFNASAMGRVMRHAGREAGQDAVRSRGAITVYEKALPKRAESPVDVAHYWWAQLPETHRNVNGLRMIRDSWQRNLLALRDESTLQGLQADLLAVEEAQQEWNAAQALLPPAERKPAYHLWSEKAQIETAMRDIPVLLKTMPEKIARLDAIIADPPELNSRIINGIRGIAHDREQVLLGTGALKPEEAANRTELLAHWLGIEPDGSEIFMGHRMGKVRGANPGGLPAKYALGRPRAASGIGSQNRMILVNNARVRESTHIVMDDWLSSQTYKNGLRARQDLGAVGTPFDPVTFDSATEVLVNPKSRSIPIAWKESGGDLLEDAIKAGYDENLIRKAADDLVHAFQSTAGDDQSVARVIDQAMADGIDMSELRVVKKDAADRYYKQTSRVDPSSIGGKTYDKAVDFMVASIVFGRVGYVPKNFVQNLVMIAPHQGVYAAANYPRALDLLTAGARGNKEKAHLVYMILADVGQGASETLGAEFTSKALGIPGTLAHWSSFVADAPGRISGFLHEAAALGIIEKTNPVLTDANVVALTRLFEEQRFRPILNDVRSRGVEAMADFSRMTPGQRKWARRFLIVPGWLWAGSRYPVHFGITHPARTAAIGYALAGEPYGDRVGLPQNQPITAYMNDAKQTFLKGINTPWGVLRTGSISPLSTPIELVHLAVEGSIVGENLNPMAVALFHIARHEIEYPSGTVKVGFWEAVLKNLERLVPDVKFAREMVNPNENSRYYPEDANRWGRFLRELGIVPIDITAGGEDTGSDSGSSDSGGPIPTPGDDTGGGSIPTPGSSSGGGSIPTPP